MELLKFKSQQFYIIYNISFEVRQLNIVHKKKFDIVKGNFKQFVRSLLQVNEHFQKQYEQNDQNEDKIIFLYEFYKKIIRTDGIPLMTLLITNIKNKI